MQTSFVQTFPLDYLLDVLVCPLCHNAFTTISSDALICLECSRAYPLTSSGQPDLRVTTPSSFSASRQATGIERFLRRVRRGLSRRVYTKLFQLASKVECCYCGWTGFRFLPAGEKYSGNRLCPKCGSLERYRVLCLYLQNQQEFVSSNITLLDVAMKPCFRDYCARFANVRYISSDLMTEGAMIFSDLTRMGIASESIDIITCLHVMEHVQDDGAAFREIARMLKPGGFAIIVVPLTGEKTFEDPSIRPEDFERYFGQFDHVRYYGNDIVERFRRAGLRVEIIDVLEYFTHDQLRRYVLCGNDRYFYKVMRT